MYSTLITVAELTTILEPKSVSVIDCRFDLAEPSAGRKAYQVAHIPSAVYADLAQDLSGPPNTDYGRHPLPSPQRIIATFSRLGLKNAVQVVLYDDSGGMFAARAWWMLRYLGHRAAAVLDGGWPAWQHAGKPSEASDRQVRTTEFHGATRRDRLLTLDELDSTQDLVDAREPRRFRGELEPLDPRAGHIPGAKNHFFQGNLDDRGFFHQPRALQQAFMTTLGKLPGSETVHYCGSGVSACHNILAQVHAGLDEPRLYCGSWSEWSADESRPAAQGDG